MTTKQKKTYRKNGETRNDTETICNDKETRNHIARQENNETGFQINKTKKTYFSETETRNQIARNEEYEHRLHRNNYTENDGKE